MNMNFRRKLPIPQEIKAQYPLTEQLAAVKAARDAEISDVFTGKSDKFVLIIGPCSADYRESVLDYISRLRVVQDKVKDKIIIIPRIYTNKPRTTGDGYKGMLHQPVPTEDADMLKGIVAIRDLHMAALTDYGFSVGARSVENQQHRLTASGLSIPVGMKNPTGGDLSIMMNAITAAQHPHTFIYRGWEVRSEGNPLAHAILRGYVDLGGKAVANYHYEDLRHLHETYAKSGLANPAVIVDTNHSNSAKMHLEQVRIARDILYSCRQNSDIRKMVKGLMIESYLLDGAQKLGAGCEPVYGQSITDPCLGWEKTEALIYEIADSI